MNILLVFAVCCGCFLVKASDNSAMPGECAASDSCRTGDQLFRTCSCDPDCATYGTCCRDSEYARKMAPPNKTQFRCHSDRTITPVYAKRACLEFFNAQSGHRTLCEDEEHDDKFDVMGNVLVTSATTKITYWNTDCGICNNEDPNHLIYWTIQVTCPSKHGNARFSKNYVERHLIYDKDMGEWGLKVEDGFMACALSFEQPRKMAGKLPYCAPNLVNSCPNNYTKKGVFEKCHAYHAERRSKGEESVYYRNAHCAQCHGVEEEDLECPGRSYGTVGVASGRDKVMVKFEEEWLERNESMKYTCSYNNSWDPFHLRCRKMPMEIWEQVFPKSAVTNLAPRATFSSSLFTIIVIAFCYEVVRAKIECSYHKTGPEIQRTAYC